MKISGKDLLVFFILACVVTACSAKVETPTPSDADSEPSSAEALVLPNVLVEVDGSVALRRIGWSDFLPADFGTFLRPGDMLRVAQSGQAMVFCGDELSWDEGPKELLGDGQEHGVPCETGRPPRPWPDVAALRGVEDTKASYVIRPRNTALLNDRPFLVLHSGNDGGETLRVISILSDDSQEREPIESADESIPWPESWPAIKPGGTYVLLIGDESADPGETLGRGFWLIDAAQTEAVRSRAAKLKELGLSDAGLDLLLAELYRSYGLNAEAIQLLEPLTGIVPSPNIWLSLGRIYMETGLPQEAFLAYTEALELAELSGDLLSAGEAHIGLALVARLQDDDAGFNTHVEAARELLEQVGSTELLQELERMTQ